MSGNNSERKTLKLGKINNDIQKNIESYTKGNKVFNKGNNDANKKTEIADSKNATEFLKFARTNSSFVNNDLIRQRQENKTFRNLNARPFPNKIQENQINSVSEEKNEEDIEQSKKEGSSGNNNFQSIDAHKILSSYAQKQKEEEKARREE